MRGYFQRDTMKFFKAREENHLASVVMDPKRLEVPMAIFSGGVFETNDADVCAKLIELGYRYENSADKAPESAAVEVSNETDTGLPVEAENASVASEALSEAAEEKQPEKMTKAQIAAYALAKYGVAIATNQSKDEMLVLLQVASEEAEEA